jgi:HSP20 family protein
MVHKQGDVQQIPVKLYRSDDRLTVAAPMPGLLPEDVLIEVTWDRRLILRGALRGMLKDDKQVLLDEWDAGLYQREIELPNDVAGDLATITYGNGVVVVALPLAEQTRGALLSLQNGAPGHGARVGSCGRPIEARTTPEFLAARGRVMAEHNGSRRLS